MAFQLFLRNSCYIYHIQPQREVYFLYSRDFLELYAQHFLMMSIPFYRKYISCIYPTNKNFSLKTIYHL